MHTNFLKVPVARSSVMAAILSLGGLALTSCNKVIEDDYNYTKQEAVNAYSNDYSSNHKNVTLEQKINAFQAFFNINSDTFGIYKDGTRDYIAQQGLTAKTLHCDKEDSGLAGVWYVRNDNDENSINILKDYPSNNTFISDERLKLYNDTVYVYEKDSLKNKFYKENNDLIYDNGLDKHKVVIKNNDTFPTPITFDATVSDDQQVGYNQ